MKEITKLFRIALGKPIVKLHFPGTPIIVCGCARTGTTLMQSILGAHPNIYSLEVETAEFTGGWKKEKNGNYKPLRIDRFYKYFLKYKVPFGPKRYCTKRPRNVRYIKEILNYHNGNVRIIQMIRDARDTLTSKLLSKSNEYYVSFKRYIQDVTAGLEYAEHPLVHVVKYENLVTNFEPTIKEILKFLNEDYTNEIENWPKYTTIKNSSAWTHKAKNVHNKSRKRRNSEIHQKRVEAIMNNEKITNLLNKMNYLD